MARYLIPIALAAATAATAFAAIDPASHVEFDHVNVTVIEKNQAFPQFGPLTFETCAVEDCSDVKG